jgi:YVTN family beta-propeller protein
MSAPRFRTFVIADLRGYTRYSAAFGDDAAAAVTVRFGEIAESVAGDTEGELVEVRGDEVLLAYASARQAMRGAIELQRRCRGPDGVILPVGAGIDAGEPVAVGEGYRGGSLNLAARLCGMAAPGQTLVSDTTVSLARRVEGVTLRELKPTRLKGIERPVRAWELDSEQPLPAVPTAPSTPPEPRPPRSRGSRRSLVIPAVAVLAVMAAVVAVFVVRAGGGEATGGPAVPANSLVAIDPSDGSVKRVVPVQLGGYPVSVCYGEGAVWTYNSDEQTLIQIDPDHGPVRVRGIGVAPTDVVAGNGYVWVASPETAQVLQLDPVQSTPELIDLGLPPAGQYGAYALALTPGRLWIAAGLNNSVLSVNTATGEVEHNRDASLEFQSFYEISASSTQVWAAENVEAASAVKLAPSTGKPLDPPVVLTDYGHPGPNDDIVAADQAVWYAHVQNDTVYRIDPASPSRVIDSVRVGDGPTGITVDGRGRPWVTNSLAGTVSLIDPAAGTVTQTVQLGHTPTSIAYGGGLLWVTVQAG